MPKVGRPSSGPHDLRAVITHVGVAIDLILTSDSVQSVV
jgi:hypothetical protein